MTTDDLHGVIAPATATFDEQANVIAGSLSRLLDGGQGHVVDDVLKEMMSRVEWARGVLMRQLMLT